MLTDNHVETATSAVRSSEARQTVRFEISRSANNGCRDESPRPLWINIIISGRAHA